MSSHPSAQMYSRATTHRRSRHWVGYLIAFMALILFAGLAALPWVVPLGHVPSWVIHNQADGATSTHKQLPIPALPTTRDLADAQGPRATLPAIGPATQAADVKNEDKRIRTALRGATRLVAPTLRQIGSGLPTLILPGRPAPYTDVNLSAAGALVQLPNGGGRILVDSVVGGPGSTINLGGPDMRVLRLKTTRDGFASIVISGGTLNLFGAAADAPTTVTSWNPALNDVATDTGTGRSYIRAIASTMTIRNARLADLGFGSGRTGGVAWTGSNQQTSTGSATSSIFEGNAYGAYLSSASKVRFSSDIFESNEADGLRVHRNVSGTTVTSSVAARNGANGFVIGRASSSNTIRGNRSINNTGAGFLVDGRAVVKAFSASGAGTAQSSGTRIDGNLADSNGRAGVLVQGGLSTLVTSNTICSPTIGIALRNGATGTHLVGNNVRCGGLVGLEIDKTVAATHIDNNTFAHARIGVLIRGATGTELSGNRIDSNSIFGISVRGAGADVTGSGNVVSGVGLRSLDVQQGASQPNITNTDVSQFTHRIRETVASYFRYHPILIVWAGIVVAVGLASIIARLRRRRRPRILYAHATTIEPGPIPVGTGTTSAPKGTAEDTWRSPPRPIAAEVHWPPPNPVHTAMPEIAPASYPPAAPAFVAPHGTNGSNGAHAAEPPPASQRVPQPAVNRDTSLAGELLSGQSWIGANGSEAPEPLAKHRRREEDVDEELSAFSIEKRT